MQFRSQSNQNIGATFQKLILIKNLSDCLSFVIEITMDFHILHVRLVVMNRKLVDGNNVDV